MAIESGKIRYVEYCSAIFYDTQLYKYDSLLAFIPYFPELLLDKNELILKQYKEEPKLSSDKMLIILKQNEADPNIFEYEHIVNNKYFRVTIEEKDSCISVTQTTGITDSFTGETENKKACYDIYTY